MTKEMAEEIDFEITRIDPLGQGVSLSADHVDFIAKTLPGEKGKAAILSQKGKKVRFAELSELSTQAPHREKPECPHFSHCSGCSFLHTNYDNEIEYKTQAYSYLFRNFYDASSIKTHIAPNRLGYRNRVQLHYDLNKNTLGFFNNGAIHEVPECKLPKTAIKEKIKELYKGGKWLRLLPEDSPATGHIEISESKGVVQLKFNERYAADGFSQVFEEMGTLAKEVIQSFRPIPKEDAPVIIDLFGGSGFLTNGLNCKRLVVDYGLEEDDQSSSKNYYLDLNLYNKNAVKKLSKAIVDKFGEKRRLWLYIDPPRSGLKNLDEFIDVLKPDYIAYLSCNPHTQVRDIAKILDKNWLIEEVSFFDFFPGTHHLESLVHLKKKF